MASFSLVQIKRQASSFVYEKYKNVKLFSTDGTQAELMAEEATNNEPCSPDANTMTRIAEASYDIDDYWRIATLLHRRLHKFDGKQWRQSYKSLILLDFLLTHGPEEFAKEFDVEIDAIRDLGSFQYKDEKGIDWGLFMRKRSDRILQLLQGGETFIQERLKALKITNEIKGFGNLMISPSSSESSCETSIGSGSSGSWSSGRDSATSRSSSGTSETDEQSDNQHKEDESHIWNFGSYQESGSLIDVEDDEDSEEENPGIFMKKICSKLGISPRVSFGKKATFTSVPNDPDSKITKMQRQFSIP